MDKDKSEPSLVPEWLKNSGSGNATGGGTTSASSSSLSDDQGVSKHARNKSLVNVSDHDSVRSPRSDRTTSSYFRRNSSSNGSVHSRSYSSFSRSQPDRDWGNKDIYKEKSVFGDYRPNRDYSDSLGNILPNRFEKDGLRRSQSSISGKRSDPWAPKVAAADSINANNNNHRNVNLVTRGSNNALFEREFPSLGAEERQADTEIKRVPSPVLSTIQNLPIGSSAVIGGDGWTSALAEVPVIVASNGSSVSALAAPAPAPAPASAPASVASSPITGSVLNMAEAVAQGPPRVQTTPQLSVGTQRLEELALKQSRQLIPVITSAPKALVLNTSDKSKPKIGQQQHQISSPHLINHSPRGGLAKPDLSKPSTIGKLQVLKLARERNGISPVQKDNNSSSPTHVTKLPNSPSAVTPSVVGAAPLRSPGSNPLRAGADCKPALSEKRPTPNAQSRHDFFNLMRKKSMANSSPTTPDPSPAVSPPVLDKPGEMEAAVPPQYRNNQVLDTSSGAQLSDGTHSNDGSEKFMSNGKILIPYTEEEEVSLLRSMGWDENSGEEEGLTEEEINAFRSKYANSKPSAKVFPRMGSPKSDQDH